MATVYHYPGNDFNYTIELFNKRVKQEKIIDIYLRSKRYKSKNELKRLKISRLKSRQKKTRPQN